MSEKAFNQISPLLKMRCKLSYYWHSLSIDHRDLFSELIKNKDKPEVKKMKNVIVERIRYKMDEYRELLENTDDGTELLENFLDDVEMMIDDWYEENQVSIEENP